MKKLFRKVVGFIKEVHYIQVRLWEEALGLNNYNLRLTQFKLPPRDSKGRFVRVMKNGFKSVNKL